ncbi:TetR family transcriptional regulator [Leptolyngbya valderiana BDU 20041]|nr:TetR/AcrR family transcriptional regulator [Geitlerinema sp. CS-897]OAB62676.1 TetR family transcriptional regulator [Leptolyngbya valderiana BDU 20041]PPT08033.1 Transcriptional regulator TetR family [Geitlerinema sp. FC II]
MPKTPRFTPKHNEEKQSRNAEVTKANILSAAIEEFAQYGLSGARTENIAKRSGVTKAMICYYFKNKKTLYQAVLNQLVLEINESFESIDIEQQPVEQALESIVRSYIKFESKNRWHGMLWFQEALQNQGRYGEQTGWQEGFQSIVKLLEKGINEGVFRKVDPFLTAINILGICSFYFDAHENLKYLEPDRELLSSETIEQQTDAVLDLLVSGLMAS